MTERLHPSPKREARRVRAQAVREKRPYRVDYDLAYDGGCSIWSGYYRTQVGARVAAWWNVHVSSWGGTAALGLTAGQEGQEK